MMEDAGMLLRHFADCARRAQRSGDFVYTDFIDGAQLSLARQAAREELIPVSFHGGYDDAERVIAAFGPEYAGEPQPPIALLSARWNAKFAACGHRDILGSLMALGVERSSYGDILVDSANAVAYVFVLQRMRDYICANWNSAGRAVLTVEPCEAGDVTLPEPEGALKRVTVQTARLDAFIAAVFNMSRGDAQTQVRRGNVKLNYVECLRNDAKLAAGDLVSVRGSGRFKLAGDLLTTRKDRLACEVFVYKSANKK